VRGRVAIVGLGYVGLPLAMACAKSGWRVLGIDNSRMKVQSLKLLKSYIEDVSEQELRAVFKGGKFEVSESYSDISEVDIVILCVPTPLNEDGLPELSYLKSAIESSAQYLKAGTLIVNESTSFPGTLREIIKPTIERILGAGSRGIQYASAPERIDPGNEKWNLKATPRIVSGLNEESTQRAVEFYSTICDSVISATSPEVAEMAKLVENTFRQVNIAFVNQLVPLCDLMGIDVREVIDAAGTKPYGFMKFFPGAGVGGHCIPIDPLYLLWKARELGLDLPFVAEADRTNKNMPKYVVGRLIRLGSLRPGDKVLILGVSYKHGVSDVRESPAIDVANELERMGIQVFWSDPLVQEFEVGSKWSNEVGIDAGVIVTYQHGLPVEYLKEVNVPILDCTGFFKGSLGICQL